MAHTSNHIVICQTYVTFVLLCLVFIATLIGLKEFLPRIVRLACQPSGKLQEMNIIHFNKLFSDNYAKFHHAGRY